MNSLRASVEGWFHAVPCSKSVRCCVYWIGRVKIERCGQAVAISNNTGSGSESNRESRSLLARRCLHLHVNIFHTSVRDSPALLTFQVRTRHSVFLERQSNPPSGLAVLCVRRMTHDCVQIRERRAAWRPFPRPRHRTHIHFECSSYVATFLCCSDTQQSTRRRQI